MLRYIAKHPRKAIGGLATILAAAGLAIGSGATFSAQSANPANTFTSGTLLHTNSANGLAIVTGANLKPGDVRTGEVTITNTGTLNGAFKLSESNDSSSFSAGSLELSIDDVTVPATPANVYSGDLGQVAAAGIALGDQAAGAARRYRFTVTLDAAAPNADQGKSATADYEWTEVPAA